MSRNQRMVVAALVVAVLVVLGCFGGYLLTYLLAGFPAPTSPPVERTASPTEYPAQTTTVPLTPTQAKSDVDYEYQLCGETVLDSWWEISNYIVDSAKTYGAGRWCQDQPTYQTLAEGLESYHLSCPDPHHGPLLEAQRNLVLAVGYQVVAVVELGYYCAEGGSDSYWMLQALDHLEEATPYAEQADKLLHSY